MILLLGRTRFLGVVPVGIPLRGLIILLLWRVKMRLFHEIDDLFGELGGVVKEYFILTAAACK